MKTAEQWQSEMVVGNTTGIATIKEIQFDAIKQGYEEAAAIAQKHFERTLKDAKEGLAKGEVVLGHRQLICDVIYHEILNTGKRRKIP